MEDIDFIVKHSEETYKHIICFLLKEEISQSEFDINNTKNRTIFIIEKSLNSLNKHLYFIYIEELFWIFMGSFNIISLNIMNCLLYHLKRNIKSISKDVILSKMYIDLAKSILEMKTFSISSKNGYNYRFKILACKFLTFFPSNNLISYLLKLIETEQDETMRVTLRFYLKTISYRLKQKSL